MFRLFAFSVTFIGVLSIGSAQSLSDLKMTLPSLEERYKMDYDIQGLFNPSADTLADLNLEQYEELRQVDNDVEVYDPATGFKITIYSVNKAIENYTYRFKKDEEDQ
ncbi:MAG TPA: hypothetical protein PK511_13055 [Chitinophagales bacterium]|nr:hypothetical protein [Chitinophagales bacterium]HMU69452.1 hypothetical protein [Chitinophagales bacterium]HMX05079.1 hypothetical protein [Chitinophagales bacterium]HMZ90057.1 hypothetical protein [Chitinophagales bacterium]HNA56735.1 hypothetical protein [Chitinophagales bacterium]